MKHVLITSGATREPIDSVRYITNFSTGTTGAALADFFYSQGAQVLLLRGQDSAIPRHASHREFTSFKDLSKQLREMLQERHWDVCIHAAAVSDFSVTHPHAGKMDSQAEFTLKLTRNPKLVEGIKTWSQSRALKLVAFKLTDTQNERARAQAIAGLFTSARADLVVHNDASDIRRGLSLFSVYTTSKLIQSCASRLDLAQKIWAGI